jgi:cytochrome b561
MSSPGESGANAAPAAVDAPASPAAYSRTAVVLHWLIALFIACGFPLGVYMVDLHASPTKVRLFAYHKWIGMTVLALVLIRSIWRLTHTPPPHLPMPRWQRLSAHSTHYLLYLLLIVTPLCGWLYTSATGYPVVYLKLWQIPDLVHKNKELADVLGEVHGDLAWALLGLVVLHSAAALKHHFVDHDSTLRRMLAWRRS